MNLNLVFLVKTVKMARNACINKIYTLGILGILRHSVQISHWPNRLWKTRRDGMKTKRLGMGLMRSFISLI